MTDEPLDLCLAGEISPQVALARLLFLGATPDSIAAMLRRKGMAPGQSRGIEVLLETKRDALAGLAEALAGGLADHAASARHPADIGAFFDRAVAHSPEASVALYSLADPAMLALATEEVLGWLRSHGLLGGDVLDLGCGIGRVAARLSAECRSVAGVDVSAGMIAEAIRRHGDLANARFVVTTGEDLRGFADGSLDLVLAVDSFPYVVQLGDDLAQTHFAEAARVLREGGHLAILNLSYRGDDRLDAADMVRWASHARLAVAAKQATRPFALWDGVAYLASKSDQRR